MNNINSYLYSDMAFNSRWIARGIRCFYPLTGLRFIWTRWEFPYILNVLGLTGEGVEVGVLYGNFRPIFCVHGRVGACTPSILGGISPMAGTSI
mgnify:CR=1 FL=1